MFIEEMYTIESLKGVKLNQLYNDHYGITENEVCMVNKYKDAIRKSRSSSRIKVGDIIEVTDKFGTYYEDARAGEYNYETNKWIAITDLTPYIVFNQIGEVVFGTHINVGIAGETPDCLPLIGKRTVFFCVWGHRAGKYGLIYFEAEVNVWEYKHNSPLHGSYTTKDWQRFYISYDLEGNQTDSRYSCFSSGFVFPNKHEYSMWLKTYRGVEFEGYIPGHKAVFCYREADHLINKDEWDKLDLPMDTRFCNGINLCKVYYNHGTHTIHVYRFDNKGHLDCNRYKEYELARGRDLINII